MSRVPLIVRSPLSVIVLFCNKVAPLSTVIAARLPLEVVVPLTTSSSAVIAPLLVMITLFCVFKMPFPEIVPRLLMLI